MSIQSVVNTNNSSVTDPNGIRGELPSSVMAFDMGLSNSTAGNAMLFQATSNVGYNNGLVAGTEKVGAYAGKVLAGLVATAGAFQVITMTFAVAHDWTAATHYGEVSFVGGGADGSLVAQTDALSAGTGQVSFPTTTTLVIKRTCGAVAGVTNQNLQAASFVVRVRDRGVSQA